MNQEPGEKLRDSRVRRGWSVKQLARQMGYSDATIWHHENGTRGIPPKAAREYERLLGLPVGLILYGKDFNQSAEKEGILLTRKVALLTLPLLDCRDISQFHAIAGGARPMSDKSIFAPVDLPEGHRVFAVQMPDSSMEGDGAKSIYRGEPTYIDPDAPYGAGDIIAALLDGSDKILIRKYRQTEKMPDGVQAFDLVALNPDFGSQRDAHLLSATVLGKVVGFYRAV